MLLAKSENATIDEVLRKMLVDQFESSECYICGDASATVQCSNSQCTRAFHIVCGEKSHCLSKYIEPFDSYCHEHHRLFEKPYPSWTCQSCLEKFGNENPVDCIHSCCDQGWYHRQCIRKQAHFSGDNMKCPSCGAYGEDRNKFQKHIRKRGVFIPNRSALYPLSLKKGNNCVHKQ